VIPDDANKPDTTVGGAGLGGSAVRSTKGFGLNIKKIWYEKKLCLEIG